MLELIEKDHSMYKEYKSGEFYTDGPLPWQDFPDNKGVGIITGMRRHEFISSGMPHLVGIGKEMMDEDTQKIDEAGADVILEEMYEDMQVKPKLVK